MRLNGTRGLFASANLGMATVFALCAAAHAARAKDGAIPSPVEQQYQVDRANCLSGKTAESSKTCLVEAAAALQAARSSGLTTPAPEQVAANRRKRCEALTGDNKKDCLERAAGIDTSVFGSVADGGDLKETVTVIPGAPISSGPHIIPASRPAGFPPKESN